MSRPGELIDEREWGSRTLSSFHAPLRQLYCFIGTEASQKPERASERQGSDKSNAHMMHMHDRKSLVLQPFSPDVSIDRAVDFAGNAMMKTQCRCFDIQAQAGRQEQTSSPLRAKRFPSTISPIVNFIHDAACV